MKSPAQIAASGSEYSHQVALFAWSNMAAQFGLRAANDPLSYAVAGHARKLLAAHDDRVPALRWLHAIKNAGHGDAVRGARNAAEGVKAGVPDLFLPVPVWKRSQSGLNQPAFFGLYIELKRPGAAGKAKGRTSDKQDAWSEYLMRSGYRVAVAWGWEPARDCLLEYLQVMPQA